MSGEPAPDVAVSAAGVSKAFKLPHEQMHTLKERFVHPLRRRTFDRLEALQDVSFEVGQGESFGIVGRNGSGKSTLMKCLAGIYATDTGEMWLRGRMAPFIELGVGFNPDLTAAENVLINAVMLGLSPAQARERHDSILDFAELHDFADMKLKNYSSGMQVRLAFSVMVHVDADLLLIDEVLAVGDAAFQQKCYDTLARMREEGRTILLVTHDMSAVQRFCDRAMLLERGVMTAIGPSREVSEQYIELNFPRVVESTPVLMAEGASGEGGARILEAWCQDTGGQRVVGVKQGDGMALGMRVAFDRTVEDPIFGMNIDDAKDVRAMVVTSQWADPPSGRFGPGDTVDVYFTFDNWLAPGRYAISPVVAAAGTGIRVLARHDEATTMVVTGPRAGGGIVDIPAGTVVVPVVHHEAVPAGGTSA